MNDEAAKFAKDFSNKLYEQCHPWPTMEEAVVIGWEEAVRRQMQPELYLIWSEEHGRWWRPSSGGQTWGYTSFLTEAGRYSKAEADRIVAVGNKVIHPESGFLADRAFNEIAIPDPLQKRED